MRDVLSKKHKTSNETFVGERIQIWYPILSFLGTTEESDSFNFQFFYMKDVENYFAHTGII